MNLDRTRLVFHDLQQQQHPPPPKKNTTIVLKKIISPFIVLFIYPLYLINACIIFSCNFVLHIVDKNVNWKIL